MADGDTQVRDDGWMNLLTMAGSRKDKTTTATFRVERATQRDELEGLYAKGGIARRIVDVPVKDMTREWFDIQTEGDEGAGIIKDMEALHIQAETTWAAQMGRLFGGAWMFLLIDDGGEIDQPVNEAEIRSIQGVRVYDKNQVTWTSELLNRDPANPNFGYPDRYNVQPVQGEPFFIHESRLIRFRGLRVPDRLYIRNNHYDYSVLDPVMQAMRNHAEGQTGASAIIQDFIQSVLSIKGLSEMLGSGNEKIVKDRLDILDLSRHILNTIILDADEEQYSKVASSVSGLSQLLDSLRMEISAITGIPMTKLWTRSPSGLNSTGESDLRNYYDDLAGEQVQQLNPPMERIVRLFMLAKDGATRGQEPTDWSIRWRPLWQPTEKEQADARYNVAQADKIYLEGGVLSPAEVAESRFGRGEYSMETTIDPARTPTVGNA